MWIWVLVAFCEMPPKTLGTRATHVDEKHDDLQVYRDNNGEK